MQRGATMLGLDRVLASALSEMRSVRRLVRTWMFVAVALLIGLIGYGQQVFFHAIGSGVSVTVGAMMAPRFVVAQLGTQMLWVLMVGLVFIAFDVRARDRRERVDEVLDSRPVDNVEVLLGRLLGIVLIGWLPVAVLAFVTIVLGVLARAGDWWISPGIEPLSLVSMLFVDVPASLALWVALVMFVAIVARNRLVAACVGMVLVGLHVLAFVRLPFYLVPVVVPIGDVARLPSDVAPVVPSLPSLLQRLGFLAGAGALLTFGAALHPRRDSRASGRAVAIGVGLSALAALGIGNVAVSVGAARERFVDWATAHKALAEVPRGDVQSVSGRVAIDPGKRLAIDIEMAVTAPREPADRLLFSFNPGLAISDLRVNGEPGEFTHALGLLAIPSPEASEFTLAIRAEGSPEVDFAYLDGAFDPATMRAFEGGALFLLGTRPAMFDRRYVALMPGIRWLPMPGANVGADAPGRGRDFFNLDIEVETPADWLVAGPGRRQPIGETTDTRRVRFSPGAPVVPFGVFAAPFERFSVEVEGVVLELLASPKHAGNLRVFGDAQEELVRRIDAALKDAAALGLPYPYDGFSLVEIPAGVRSYVGGWRMDTALALPGVVLMPEAGLPLAEFGFHLRDREVVEGRDGGIPGAKVDALVRSLQNDFGGGNPLLGAARNFLAFQTGPRGEGAPAVDAVLQSLANRLVTNREGYFSAHGIQAQLQQAVAAATLSTVAGQGPSVLETIRNVATDRPAVWDRALGQSLAGLDVGTDPALAVNAMVLKTDAIARTILYALGREQAGALLAELRRRYAGTTFTAEEFGSLAAELGTDLEPILGDWLYETAMAGFVASPVRGFRLPDSDTGEPRYQVLVHVRNDEPAPGLFWLEGDISTQRAQSRGTRAMRIDPNSSMEVGLVTPATPVELRLEFHMALNREPPRLRLPTIDSETIVDAEPFTGGRQSTWAPSPDVGVVVDDLDPGFSIEYDEGAEPVVGGGLAIALGALPSPHMDEGLPEFSAVTRAGGTWSRWQHHGAWGKYRHTLARAGITRSNARAVFSTELPSTGRWRLDYHIPRMVGSRSQAFSIAGTTLINRGGALVPAQGMYDMTLHVGGHSRPLEFDGNAAEGGWNRLGAFDITDRNVKVVVANRAVAGDTVLADAVRWTSVE